MNANEECKMLAEHDTADRYVMLESCKSGFYVHVDDNSYHFLTHKKAEAFYNRQVMLAAA